jgi:hypothetical protein
MIEQRHAGDFLARGPARLHRVQQLAVGLEVKRIGDELDAVAEQAGPSAHQLRRARTLHARSRFAGSSITDSAAELVCCAGDLIRDRALQAQL